MARNSDYQEKNNPILSVLYVLVVIALVVALGMMYMNYRERRSEYKQIVAEASRSDVNLDIESRRDNSEVEEETAEVTAETTEAPAVTEAPIAEDELMEAESVEEEPGDQLVLPDLNVEENAG